MHSVNVMMSTYNGEKYIEEQILSIEKQKNVDMHLFIRDDGSSDSTIHVIERLMSEYGNITLFQEENIGWKKSFFELLRLVPDDADYYAFSDQDDVWLEDKLERACNTMDKSMAKNRCYCSELTFVNENLDVLMTNNKKRFHQTNLYHSIVNGYGMGCTLVFDKNLLVLLRKGKLDNLRVLSHDWLVSVVATYLGEVERDTTSTILYRQHSGQAGSLHENSVVKIKKAFDFSQIYWMECARYMLDTYADELDENKKKILLEFVEMHKFKNKIKLLFNKYISRDSVLGTLKVKVYILLYRKKSI